MNIKLENISFSYDHKQVLQGINLHIAEGSLTLLCGITGSGKSTLLRLMSGLYKTDAGCISYVNDGEPLSVSMVFQQPETQLFASSAYKDIEYGLEQRKVPRARRSELVHQALDKVGLPHELFSHRSPFLLSGGEKRRLCIAGAIALTPELLILDEPTAGLDPPAVRGLLQTLQELRHSGLTVVIGTHDLDSFLPIADQAVVMSQGSIHYQGPVTPLIEEPAKLREAGLEIPAYARIGSRLKSQGLLSYIPDSSESLLQALQAQVLPASPHGHSTEIIKSNNSITEVITSKTQVPEGILSSEPVHSSPIHLGQSLWQSLDPRVKWFGMVVWTLLILGMNTPVPLLLTTGIIAALIGSAGIPWRRTAGFFKPFLIMFVFLWMISSVSLHGADWELGPVGISYSGMIQGGFSILRFVLMIALGFLFTETTTGSPLREALEWAIAPLKKLGIRTRNWSLAVSITLQFVPWILRKLSQLQLALRSRGPRKSPFKRWAPGQISLLIVPLLILVISMGDELATSIESRGYDPSKERTPWIALTWQRRDTFALAFILLTAAGLWLIS